MIDIVRVVLHSRSVHWGGLTTMVMCAMAGARGVVGLRYCH